MSAASEHSELRPEGRIAARWSAADNVICGTATPVRRSQ